MTCDAIEGPHRLIRMSRLAALSSLALSSLLGAGCSYMKAAAFFMQPETEKIAPEFRNLEDRQVLIYVWAPPEILWDYTKLRLDLSGYLAAYLQQQVKNARVVDPIRVERHIEQQRIHEIDPVELGRHFNADVVVHLSVYQFSMRDPEMAHFYRGRIGASVQVHDLTQPDEPQRVTLQDARVVVPEEGPIGIDNTTSALIRQRAYDAFTVEVGKKFHQWERPINQ